MTPGPNNVVPKVDMNGPSATESAWTTAVGAKSRSNCHDVRSTASAIAIGMTTVSPTPTVTNGADIVVASLERAWETSSTGIARETIRRRIAFLRSLRVAAPASADAPQECLREWIPRAQLDVLAENRLVGEVDGAEERRGDLVAGG